MPKEKLLYDILTAVPQSRSITDISKKLYMSQPYISQVIHYSEEKYGVKLINRKKLPISLTYAGRLIIKDLARIIESQNKLEIDLSPLTRNNRSFVKLAFNRPWVNSIGIGIIQELKQYYPNTKFSLNEKISNNAENDLITQEIDIFIGEVLNNSNLISYHTYRLKLFFIIPENSKLYKAGKKTYKMNKNSLKKLNNRKLISLTEDSFFQKTVNHMLSDNEVTPQIDFKVSNVLAATQMAIDGLGIAISPFNAIKDKINFTHRFNLVEIPKEILKLDLGISVNKNCSTYIKRIAKTIKVLMQKEAHNNDEY